ncbi:glycosyltransferase family 32 protein [Acetobacter pasteurianus]|nr:glycosyltransferase [Acetobacter pasteurianus]
MSTQSKRPNPPHVKMDFFRCLHEGVESGWLPTLAQADLDPPSQSILPPNIPKRISQYWHSETLPDDVARSIEKVKNNNPGFELVLTHDESARAFLHTHFGQDMVALFDVCFHPAMRSDLWRMCDMYVHGGIYVDVDISMHAPLAHITGHASYECFLMYAVGTPWCIENGLIISRKKHPVIEAIIHALCESLTRYKNNPNSFENIWVNSGPGTTTIGTIKYLYDVTPEWADHACGDGFLLGHHSRAVASYGHDELAYKAFSEGNWRKARPPHRRA